MRMYSGPELPASQTALIQGVDSGINIVICDGVKVTSTAVSVLPGEHVIGIQFYYKEMGYSKDVAYRKFTAEAGHVYSVGITLNVGPGRYDTFIMDKTTGRKMNASNYTVPGSEQGKLEVAEKSIKEHPQNANFWAEKGDILVRMKRYEEALPALDTAISLNSNLHLVWAEKSWALYEIKRYNDALIAIDKAIQLRPNTPQYLKGRKIITDAMEGRFASREEIEALTRE